MSIVAQILLATLIGLIQGNINELPPAENVKLVFVGFRHANRNPGQFLKDDPNVGKWGLEGESMLTKIGKQQAFAYGKQLRERYRDLVNVNWMPEEVKVFSSSADRVQGTVQTTVAGLFPPKGYADWSNKLDWQPVSYTIDDQLLRMYSVKCPTSDDSWDVIYAGKTPEGAELLEENKDVIKFVAKKTGLDPTLGNMADVADNLEGMHIRGLKMPKWVKKNFFKKNIYKDIENLAEAPQVLCSKHDACRRMMTGYWLEHIFKNLNESSYIDGPLEAKMFIYGTHNEIMSSLLWQLGHERPHGVYFHGSGILEYRDTPDKAVRLIYSEPTPEDPKKRSSEIVKICGDDEWCPLEIFMLKLDHGRFSDWEMECGLPDCSCALTPENIKALQSLLWGKFGSP